jgi:hypothetical protein
MWNPECGIHKEKGAVRLLLFSLEFGIWNLEFEKGSEN